MTLEQLITFEAVATHGSFKAASEAMHKSQPSLSVAIRNLEEELGVKLFSRDDYRPKLTSQGEVLLKKARKILEECEDFSDFAGVLKTGVEPVIKLGLDAISWHNEILCSIKSFFDQYDQTDVVLEQGILGEMPEKVIDGELDAAFSPVVVEHSDLECHSVLKVKMVPVCAPSMLGEKALSLASLKKCNQIIVRDSSQLSSHLSFGVLKGGKSWRISSNGLKKSLILAGLGWGRLPLSDIETELAQKKLIAIDLPEITSAYFDVAIQVHRHRPRGPVLKALIEKFSSKSQS
ncbi:MAG: hypothetical protein CME71_10490 [Halobacteriovorax sp.]|nr:hypothetical protein [Halobacteriovorax sp.]